MKIIFFSGFLGDPTDWDFLRASLSDFDVESHAVEPGLTWQETCQNWVKAYSSSAHDSILVGYSLGGRMAAQLAVGWPELFRGLIAISTHPGLRNLNSRTERVQNDLLWAERFSPRSQENWDELLRDWDSQSVFGNISENRPRPETNELRLRCERQLKNLSLGLQSDLRELLLACPLPQIWITGEQDQKFDTLAKDLATHSALQFTGQSIQTIRHISVAGHGHRWPWTASKAAVGALLRESIFNLMKEGKQS